MIGRRRQPNENGWFNDKLEPGEYVRLAPLRADDGREFTDEEKQQWWNQPYWLCCSPNSHVGNLSRHTIVEHDDGTITVSPSILISDGKGTELWHGYLERGVWRSV